MWGAYNWILVGAHSSQLTYYFLESSRKYDKKKKNLLSLKDTSGWLKQLHVGTANPRKDTVISTLGSSLCIHVTIHMQREHDALLWKGKAEVDLKRTWNWKLLYNLNMDC